MSEDEKLKIQDFVCSNSRMDYFESLNKKIPGFEKPWRVDQFYSFECKMMLYALDTLRVTYRLSLGNNQTGKSIDSKDL